MSFMFHHSELVLLSAGLHPQCAELVLLSAGVVVLIPEIAVLIPEMVVLIAVPTPVLAPALAPAGTLAAVCQ